jgi:FkbM family methyltransferase
MKVEKLCSILNYLLDQWGGQIVSSAAARHMSMLKAIRQHGADLDILRLIVQCEVSNLNGKTFNIVQIGANDGKRHDPYRSLIETNHFSGVLVEPIPEVYKKLVSNYKDQPQLHFENSAIGPNKGEMALYMLRDTNGQTDELSVFASFNEDEVLKYKKRTKQELSVESITVPVITFANLLEKHCIESVSLLAIDTEGFDYQILKSIDLNKIRPQIIEFEHSHLSAADETECHRLLMSNGYELHRFFGDDTLAIRRK